MLREAGSKLDQMMSNSQDGGAVARAIDAKLGAQWTGASGETGRRAGLRIQWGDPWEFKSPLAHQSSTDKDLVGITGGIVDGVLRWPPSFRSVPSRPRTTRYSPVVAMATASPTLASYHGSHAVVAPGQVPGSDRAISTQTLRQRQA